MLNNNHKNSVCAYAEPLISYLYGEIGNAEKAEFEAHLKICTACSNELAEFGFARSAVQEWRIEEFDKLATPIFNIPADVIKTKTIAAKASRSWFADWRQVFSFKPALAMSAFAAVVVLFGVTLLVFNFKPGNEIAGNNDNPKLVKTIVSPTVENVIELPKTIADDNFQKSAAPIGDLPTKAIDKKPVAPKNPPIKVSTNAPKNNLPQVVPVRAIQDTNKGNQKATAVQKSKVPRLTDAEEEEDNSVRLADLFDEIETR